MIRVLLVDDHPIVRQGLKRLLSEDGRVAVVGEAETGADLLALLPYHPVDVVVLDWTMPGQDGRSTLAALRQQYPKLPVVVFSFGRPTEEGIQALQAGAAAFVGKESAPEVLLGAIQHVASGRKYIPSELAEHLAQYPAQLRPDQPHQRLSPREREVLALLGTGKTLTQVAACLGLSVKTASTYRTRMIEKMGLSTTADLMRYAVRQCVTPEAPAPLPTASPEPPCEHLRQEAGPGRRSAASPKRPLSHLPRPPR